MAEETRSGRLDMPLVVLEDDINLHLNSAQASLDTQQIKYARKGLLSAAIVSAQAKLALTHAQFVDAKERSRFQEYMALAVKLINAYWEDFGLTLLKSAHTGESVQARVQPKAEPTKPPLKPPHGKAGGQSALSPDKYTEFVTMLMSDEIDRYETKKAFFRDLAHAWGLTVNAVQQAYYSRGGGTSKSKTNGH